MLVIRFKKIGRRNQRTWRLIVTPKKSPPRGRPIEYLGWWNPYLHKGAFKGERIKHWISRGAQLSATAEKLLKREKAL